MAKSIRYRLGPDEASLASTLQEDDERFIHACRLIAQMMADPRGGRYSVASLARRANLTENTVRLVIGSPEFRDVLRGVTELHVGGLLARLTSITEDNLEDEEVRKNQKLMNETIRTLSQTYERLAKASDGRDRMDGEKDIHDLLKSLKPASSYEQKKIEHESQTAERQRNHPSGRQDDQDQERSDPS